MVKVVLTDRVAIKGRVAPTNLPAVEYSNATEIFTEIVLTGHGLTIPEDVYYYIIFMAKQTNSSQVISVEIRQPNGIDVIQSFLITSMTTSFTEKMSTKFHNDTGASFVPRFYMKKGNANAGSIQIQALTGFVGMYAENDNLSDIQSMLSQIDNIYIMGNITEGINGKVNSVLNDILEIPIDSLMSKIVWSANSGTLIWSWDGKTIKLED